jgi:UDP-glucose-4-epimerase GalE
LAWIETEMVVLVVGGAGYIGSHSARALQRAGHRVRIYDNLSTGHAFLADGFELIIADIQDCAALSAAMSGVDAVMHFAAHAYVGESVAHPRKYFDNNVTSALVLLNTALDCGIRKLIFSSSCAVYGIPESLPITEYSARSPINPYGASKLFFENALEAYGHAYGLHSACLRYFNAAGADESGEIGEIHNPETHIVPLALQAAAGISPPLQLYGNDYETPDGTCIRDYVHVTDLADAHVLALDRLTATDESFSLNLGHGGGYSIRQVLATIKTVTGCSVPYKITPRRPGDPPVLIADATRGQQLLGWSARRDLPEIVSTAWKWQQRAPQFLRRELRASA